MADQKISQLNNITGANVDDTADELAIVDSSATQTKAITRGELFSDVSKITTDTAGGDVAIKALRPANSGTGDPVVIVAGDGDAGDVLLEMRGNTDGSLVDTSDTKESADAKFIFYGNGASTFNGPLTLDSNAIITGNLTVSGTTTTVNTQNLDVKDAVITLNSGQATPLNDIGMLFQRYSSATASNYNVVMAWDESVDKLIFGSTAEDGSDNTLTFVDEWMTITSGGNIGIGLTNPSQKLDVSGTVAARGNLVVGSDTIINSTLYTDSTTNVTRARGAIQISNPLATSREGYLTLSNGTNALSTGVWTLSIDSDATKAFYLWDETNSSYPFAVKPGNNSGTLVVDGATDRVGIGTTSPAAALDVNGDIVATGGDLDLDTLDLKAIAASKAVTAVDVFVYDTSKDSDGGAWRKRTQHTSWYNETLNTATRGSRREFPAVAVIVAESNKITIYDGDDPALPMWMVFSGGNTAMPITLSSTISSVVFQNGLLAIGMGGFDLHLINFLKDAGEIRNSSGYADYKQTIANRNASVSATYYTDASKAIVNRTVNDVAMTVLPDAPIDPATGLPVPTIAVATDGGVSVIKDDGTVADSAATLSMGQVFFDDFNGLFYQRNVTTGILWYSTKADYEAGDGFGDEIARTTFGTNSFDLLAFSGASGNLKWASDSLAIGGNVTPLLGLMLHQPNYTDQSKGMSALLTSTYNTGWMNGDIKGAFLADTDDTDLVGSGELVTNGTFDTDTSGWSSQLGAVITHTGSAMQVQSTGANSLAYQFITADLSKPYVVSVELVSSTGGSTLIQMGGSGGLSQGLSVGVNTFTIPAGRANNKLDLAPENGQTAVFDNVSVKLADADRSVNNNGLIVNGTVTRSAVATGAELVAYSGFSASNYLEQPYNSALDFGTGDFCVMGWITPTSSGSRYIVDGRQAEVSADGFILYRSSGGSIVFNTYDGGASSTAVGATTNLLDRSDWVHVVGLRESGVLKVYVNGKLDATVAGATQNINNNLRKLVIGISRPLHSYHAWFGKLALWRISATAPSPEQIKKIYEDEKVLFQENAAATLYGASDAVTALAHDEDTGLLHVGTSAGRSVFQGLRRVSNTTTAVGTAISAANGMIAEE